MCTKTYGPFQVTASTNSTTMRITPVTGWLPAQSMQHVKALITLLEKTAMER